MWWISCESFLNLRQNATGCYTFNLYIVCYHTLQHLDNMQSQYMCKWKWWQLYLKDIQMSTRIFKSGYHMVSHSDKYWSGLFTDPHNLAGGGEKCKDECAPNTWKRNYRDSMLGSFPWQHLQTSMMPYKSTLQKHIIFLSIWRRDIESLIMLYIARRSKCNQDILETRFLSPFLGNLWKSSPSGKLTQQWHCIHINWLDQIRLQHLIQSWYFSDW